MTYRYFFVIVFAENTKISNSKVWQLAMDRRRAKGTVSNQDPVAQSLKVIVNIYNNNKNKGRD